ncbi:MAG TPA: hypothetical protein V6D47_10140 [Oscillatoriaceae cyanobacterium]
MANGWQGALVQRTLGRAIASRFGASRFLDLGFGMALMRDGRVPFRAKALALACGGAVMTVLVALEVPVEGFFALFLPLIGAVADFAVDGAEEVLGALILGALLMPYVAPRELVRAIRDER